MTRALIAVPLCIFSCTQSPTPNDPLAVTQADIDHHVSAHASTPEAASQNLHQRAAEARAAIDAGLLDDPVVRAGIARLLASRHRDLALRPQLESGLAEVTDEHLRQIYSSRAAEFRQPERRRAAVLWLDPGDDPDRRSTYIDKLTSARTWLLENPALATAPDQGFSVLAIDHSEHAASKFTGGDIGWLQNSTDPWLTAVQQIAIDLDNTGDVSQVVSRPEGVFLVRLTDYQPANSIPFENVRHQLAKEESSRVRARLEAEFLGTTDTPR